MKSPTINSHFVKRTSELLRDIAQAINGDDIGVGDVIARLKNRSFALAILIFSLPNSLPMPGIPGLSTVTGIPIVCIALQIMGGRKEVWLPRSIAAKRFKGSFLAKIIRKALPAIIWMEKFLHPRLTIICQPAGERFIGLLIVIMALILALPIAGTNFLSAFSISLLALALLEDDGLLAIFGILLTLASLYLMYEVVLVVANAAIHWVGL